MKKLILLLAIFFGTIIFANAQANLVWTIQSDTFLNGSGDTIEQELFVYIPIVDRTYEDTKFKFEQRRNGEVQISKFYKSHNMLDSEFTIDGIGTKTHLQWLQLFMSVDINSLKTYGEEIWKQKIDPSEAIIRID